MPSPKFNAPRLKSIRDLAVLGSTLQDAFDDLSYKLNRVLQQQALEGGDAQRNASLQAIQISGLQASGGGFTGESNTYIEGGGEPTSTPGLGVTYYDYTNKRMYKSTSDGWREIVLTDYIP